MTTGERGVLNVAVSQVQKQSGKTEYRCFAIAWASYISLTKTKLKLQQKKLCSHLEACLLK